MQNKIFFDLKIKIKKTTNFTFYIKYIFNPFNESYNHKYTIRNKTEGWEIFKLKENNFKIKQKIHLKEIKKIPIYEKLKPIIYNLIDNINVKDRINNIKIDFDILSYYKEEHQQTEYEKKNILINYFYVKNYENEVLNLKNYFNVQFYYNETDMIIVKWKDGHINIKRNDGLKKLHKIFNKDHLIQNLN